MTTNNLGSIVYLTKNLSPEKELKQILSSLTGHTTATKYLSESTKPNVFPNIPVPEIFMAYEAHADANYDIENLSENMIFETLMDWDEIIRTSTPDDDNTSLEDTMSNA